MAEQHYISNAGETLIEGRKFLESNTSNASTQKLGFPFVGGSSLASNIFMVLIILLSAVMCALCLDSILRCALHWTRSLAVESPEELATVSGNSINNDNPGLRRMFMVEIPILIYAAQGSKLPDNIGMDCPICLGEFTEGEQVRVLPKCNHGFHADCIDTWLLSHSSCPTCRRCLLDPCNTGCQRGDSSASCVIDRQDSSRSSRRGSSHEFNLHMI